MARSTKPLSEAVEILYATFAGVEKPSAIDGCSHCWDSTKARLLLERPLRTLSGEDLSDYAASVFLTAGDFADFRYLLPRLLEIGANDPNWWPSPEVLLKKLKLAGWMSWPDNERAAIKQVIDAWFEQCLQIPTWDGRSGPSWYDGDSFICGLASAGLDLSPYLDRLVEPAFGEQLKGLYWMNFDKESGRTKLYNAFWYELQDNKAWAGGAPSGAALIAFLERPDVQARANRSQLNGGLSVDLSRDANRQGGYKS